jgi:putative DNA primase/helicase
VAPTPWAELSPEHGAFLARQAIPDPQDWGIRSILRESDLPEPWQGYPYGADVLPALLFPWGEGFQLRPDTPVTFDNGDTGKYLLPKGQPGILPILIDNAGDPRPTVLIVEGTKQSFAAASYTPDDVAVVGMFGCRGWYLDGAPNPSLSLVAGRAVVICLDADASSNRDVYDAGIDLGKACELDGATSVRYIVLPGEGKSGLDDILGARADRPVYLEALIAAAEKKPARVRPKVATSQATSPYFDRSALLVDVLSHAVLARAPAALGRDGTVAIYRDGAYRVDRLALYTACTELLGDNNRTSHRNNLSDHLIGILAATNTVLPESPTVELLNVANGMLDIDTGALMPHSPDYFSVTQLAVAWDPDASCPTYERWVELCGISGQLDDLEETVSAMLEPKRTPAKAAFLFGPSRSGKSTFLRLLRAVAGIANTSAVTLHQLADDRFMAANLYGKMLNVAPDLSSKDVSDLSTFKSMTGDDPIEAQRKFGHPFTFVNHALFCFSANTLPTVNESSRAYSERVKPFEFPVSFAGREDPLFEDAMMQELPGILRRWVVAGRRRRTRRGYLQTDAAVRQLFDARSDRARQFFSECCSITASPGTSARNAADMSTATALSEAFKRWASANDTKPMGRNTLIERLTSINGVEWVRSREAMVRGLNIKVLPEALWGSSDPGSTGSFAPSIPLREIHVLEEEKKSVNPVERKEGPKLPVLPVEAVPAPERRAYGSWPKINEVASHWSLPAMAEIAKLATAWEPECQRCGAAEALVPAPIPFIRACPVCWPDMFEGEHL